MGRKFSHWVNILVLSLLCNILKCNRNQVCQNKEKCFLYDINSTIFYREIGSFEDIEGNLNVKWGFQVSQKMCIPIPALFEQNHSVLEKRLLKQTCVEFNLLYFDYLYL